MIVLKPVLVQLISTYPISGERRVRFGLILNTLTRISGNIWAKSGQVHMISDFVPEACQEENIIT